MHLTPLPKRKSGSQARLRAQKECLKIREDHHIFDRAIAGH